MADIHAGKITHVKIALLSSIEACNKLYDLFIIYTSIYILSVTIIYICYVSIIFKFDLHIYILYI